MAKPNHIIQAANVFDSRLLSDSDLVDLAVDTTDEPVSIDDLGLPAPIEHWADARRTLLETGSGAVEEADLCIAATVVSSDFGRYATF
jgi:hypothetical protein